MHVSDGFASRVGGSALSESYRNTALAMISYMHPNIHQANGAQDEKCFDLAAHDLESLLFVFLDQILDQVHMGFAVCDVEVCNLDSKNFKIQGLLKISASHCALSKNAGTEIKAVTYSNMKVSDTLPFDIYVILDV